MARHYKEDMCRKGFWACKLGGKESRKARHAGAPGWTAVLPAGPEGESGRVTGEDVEEPHDCWELVLSFAVGGRPGGAGGRPRLLSSDPGGRGCGCRPEELDASMWGDSAPHR